MKIKTGIHSISIRFNGRTIPKSESDVGSSPTFPFWRKPNKHVDVVIEISLDGASMPPPPPVTHCRIYQLAQTVKRLEFEPEIHCYTKMGSSIRAMCYWRGRKVIDR